MKAPKKKPFIISRQPRKLPSSNDSKSLLPEPDIRALVPITKKDPQIEIQNQILASQTVFKNCYNLFKVSPNLLPELLQKYAEDNVNYRDEEFTQQADNFITRIAASKKIPKDLKAKHPLYYILISICKIFMLNEYEIVVLGCALDHCSWKVDETVYPEEADFLKEFPGNLGNEIDSDCKRLIIYLLVITFSLKQYLNEKGEVDKIHAYCESICINFQAIFNRWTRVSFYHKFNYSPLEINRKFRSLCQKETFDPLGSFNKDYNMIVDSIMNLTGSYKSKLNGKPLMPPQPAFPPSSIFHSFNLPPVTEARPIFNDLPPLPAITFERGNSRPPKPFEFVNLDEYELPMMENISRRTSSSNLFGDDYGKNKKVKMNNSTSGFGLFRERDRENFFFKEFPGITGNAPMKGMIDPEDFLNNLGLPPLSKRSSNVSQAMPDEIPNLFKSSSNMSWLNKD